MLIETQGNAARERSGTSDMSYRNRVVVLLGVTVAVIAALAAVPPIPQDPAYHHFADQRSLLGIANALNVLSNAAFTAVGIMGLWRLFRRETPGATFEHSADRWPYVVLFIGVMLTGFGSWYYHRAPDNARLVWDRLPMTVGFGGLVAAVLGERLSPRVGRVALPVLLAMGVASVLYWRATELRGVGDLRPYAFVQFFPVVLIPMLMVLFPSRYTRGGDLLGAGALYGVAKVCEHFDEQFIAVGGIVSGHTLKHLVAAAATLLIVRMLRLRRPMAHEQAQVTALTNRP
jgi:hypothetical protein